MPYIFKLLPKFRFHISLSFFAFLYISVKIADPSAQLLPVLIAFTFWHNSVYVFNKVTDVAEDRRLGKKALSNRERLPFLWISLLFMLIPPLILIGYGYPVIPLLLFYPVGILYSLPLFGGKVRIKNMYLVKNIYAAILITLAPAAVVLISYLGYPANDSLLWKNYILYLGLLFLAVEIISDIPDRVGDQLTGVKTLAVVHGFKTARLVGLGLLTLIILIFAFEPNRLGLIPPGFIGIVLFLMTEENQHRMMRILFGGWLLMGVISGILVISLS